MKLTRVKHGAEVHLARIDGERCVLLARESTHPAADALREALAIGQDFHGNGHAVPLDAVELLAPVANPSKVIALGLNYADHVRESKAEVPKAPLLFAKTVNSILGPGAPITWSSADSTEVDYEAELAVIIGRRAWCVSAEPLSYVFGYTCCNDVSARDAQFADGQWIRGKSFDTFCPLGPWIVTADEIANPQELAIRCDINGERMQDSNTSEMIFTVAELVTYISRFISLQPGDVIATGTPLGVGFARKPPRYLASGDEVTVWVQGIGSLKNPCKVT